MKTMVLAAAACIFATFVAGCAGADGDASADDAPAAAAAAEASATSNVVVYVVDDASPAFPIGGATVVLTAGDGSSPVTATSAADGRVSFANVDLSRGAAAVMAYAPGRRTAIAGVEVRTTSCGCSAPPVRLVLTSAVSGAEERAGAALD